MKKHNLIALMVVLLLLLCGCKQEEAAAEGSMKLEELFARTAASVEEGHFFFAGKVASAMAEKKMISFYDVETEKSTFYKVEVTEDPFNCLPDRTLTVCIMGNTENFPDRNVLEKGKEYLFDTTLWVQEEEVVMLLPTFYEVLPECREEALFYTDQSTTVVINGTRADYWAQLKKMTEEKGYAPQTVLSGIQGRLQQAIERNADYFEELKFEALDRAALSRTVTTAEALLEQAKNTEPTWGGIEELLK